MSSKKILGDFAAQFQGERESIIGGGLTDDLAGMVEPVKGDLLIRWLVARGAGFAPKPLMILTVPGAAGRQSVRTGSGMEIASIRPVSLARCSCRRPGPGPASSGHQQGKFQGDDLADDAQRLVEG